MDSRAADGKAKKPDEKDGRDPRESGARPARVRMARSQFSELVLVCAKCAKRQGLRKGALRGRLKRELKGRALARKPRVIAVGCLGPCPKKALAVATSASLAKQRIHLIDPEADPAEIVDVLFPDFSPKGALTPDLVPNRMP